MFSISKYQIPDWVVWITALACVLPLLFNFFGIDFGTVTNKISPYQITKISEYEHQADLKEFLLGRNLHTIFVSFTIAIAFLTVLLSFIDFRIQGDVSTPIVGVALFCAGLLDTFHILVSTQVLHVPDQQIYLTAFTWFFCRLFHASILMLGVGIILVRPDLFRTENKKAARRFVAYSAVVFVLITLITMEILFSRSQISLLGYPNKNIARGYDLIPLILYIISFFFLFPKFFDRHPSVFSQTIILSAIPAIATQLYMAFGSDELYDNNFNIAHVMTAFTYFIPFVGISLNYLQKHRNEKKMFQELSLEAGRRRKTQDILSGVLNSSVSVIMGLKSVRNRAGHIIDFEWILANRITESMFGLDPEKIMGKKMSRELPEALVDGWLDLFIKVIDGSETLNHEYYSRHFNKWLLLVGTKLNDGIAVTISDISKRKNAQKELMDSEKLAVTGRISQLIAHEIRNPLTNIDLSIQQVREASGMESPADPFLEIMTRNSKRINQLITELLVSSKPAEIQIQPCDVNALLEDAIQLALDRIHLKKIKLVKNLDASIPTLELDTAKVKTAILNLIINAVEAMEESKGVLHISSQNVNGKCVIEIDDNGKGMTRENLDHLFVPFFSKKTGGIGLGLSSARNIIISHKGSIDVESKAGVGTKFTITL